MPDNVFRAESLAELRRAYSGAGLAEADLAADPFTQLGRWVQEALDAGLTEPNAMVLATASADGQPSARTVLLKGFDERGLTFFTGYTSRKGGELAANPRASVVLPWYDLQRQVCVVGAVERTSRDETAAYFTSRPHGSQLGAWASHQSSVIGSRTELDERYAELARRYPDDVPVPDFWGGFRLVPATVEFWQGRPSRLHDRLRYRRVEGPDWLVERLSP